MATHTPQLVFGDDGSAAADVVWLWINNHRWPGWRITVVTGQTPPLGPIEPERSAPHPWTPPWSRQLLTADDVVAVEYLTAEADRRLLLDSYKAAALVAVGPRGQGVFKHL